MCRFGLPVFILVGIVLFTSAQADDGNGAGQGGRGTVGLVCVSKSGENYFWFKDASSSLSEASKTAFNQCMNEVFLETAKKNDSNPILESILVFDSSETSEKREFSPNRILQEEMELWIFCELSALHGRPLCPIKSFFK